MSISRPEPSTLSRLDPRLGPPSLLPLLPLGLTIGPRLERRIRILNQHLKIFLEPIPGLRRRHEAGIGPARLVVPHRVLVGRAVALAAGLDPHKGVEELRGRVGRRPDAETRVLDVAPMAPLEAAGGLRAGAARVDYEVRGEGGLLQIRG